jgi:hypothetical protein
VRNSDSWRGPVAGAALVKEVNIEGRRYIVCRNEAEVAKDAADRRAVVEGLDQQLKRGDKALIGNSAYRRYLRQRGAQTIVGAGAPGGIGDRPLPGSRKAQRALQAEPRPTPPHPETNPQGHELAGLRGRVAPARQLDAGLGQWRWACRGRHTDFTGPFRPAALTRTEM